MNPNAAPAGAEIVVQRQLDAYNARDIDAFMACWADDCEYHEFPSRLLASGAAAVRERHAARFREPNLAGALVNRIAAAGLVVDQETVTRTFPEGPGEVDVVAIYEVAGDRIARAWFRMGTPRLHVASGRSRRDGEAAISIRLAGPDDHRAVAAVVAFAYAPWVSRLGRAPGPMFHDYAGLIGEGRVHVAQAGGAVRGILVLIPEEGSMLLDNVAVHPDAQGRGLGRRLLAFAERAARDAGHRSVRLYTNEAMTENIALYARVGYAETYRAEEAGLRRVHMAKALD